MVDEIKEELDASMEESKDEDADTSTEESAKEETDDSSKEKSEQDLANLNKQLYARAKKAELRAKELEEKRAEEIRKFAEKPKETPFAGQLSAEEVARLSTVFDELSVKERERLITETKARGLEINSANLEETKKSEDFALWQKSWKEKVEKENIPPPSTKQVGGGKVKLSDLSPEDKREYLESIGMVRPLPKR